MYSTNIDQATSDCPQLLDYSAKTIHSLGLDDPLDFQFKADKYGLFSVRLGTSSMLLTGLICTARSGLAMLSHRTRFGSTKNVVRIWIPTSSGSNRPRR